MKSRCISLISEITTGLVDANIWNQKLQNAFLTDDNTTSSSSDAFDSSLLDGTGTLDTSSRRVWLQVIWRPGANEAEISSSIGTEGHDWCKDGMSARADRPLAWCNLLHVPNKGHVTKYYTYRMTVRVIVGTHRMRYELEALASSRRMQRGHHATAPWMRWNALRVL